MGYDVCICKMKVYENPTKIMPKHGFYDCHYGLCSHIICVVMDAIFWHSEKNKK
jgi:hypothetical protein